MTGGDPRRWLHQTGSPSATKGRAKPCRTEKTRPQPEHVECERLPATTFISRGKITARTLDTDSTYTHEVGRCGAHASEGGRCVRSRNLQGVLRSCHCSPTSPFSPKRKLSIAPQQVHSMHKVVLCLSRYFYISVPVSASL